MENIESDPKFALLPSDPEGQEKQTGGKWEFLREHYYKNADGSIFGRKKIFRLPSGGKTATWERYENGVYHQGLNDQIAPLYNLPDVIEAAKSHTPIFIPEGEKDAETVERLGLVGTSTPNGATAGFRSEWAEFLKGTKIIILTDNDRAGEKYGNILTCALWGIAESIKVIKATDLDHEIALKEDISDICEKFGNEETSQRLTNAFNRIPWITEKPKEQRKTAPSPRSKEIEKTDNQWLRDNLDGILAAIPSGDRDTWLQVCAALKHEGIPFEVFDQWSKSAINYGDTQHTWDSLKNPTCTGGTLVWYAKDYGWIKPETWEIVPIDAARTDNKDSIPDWAARYGLKLGICERHVKTGEFRFPANHCPFCNGLTRTFLQPVFGKWGTSCEVCERNGNKKTFSEVNAALKEEHEAELFEKFKRTSSANQTDDGDNAEEQPIVTDAKEISAPNWDEVKESDFVNQYSDLYRYLVSAKSRPVEYRAEILKAEKAARRCKVSLKSFRDLLDALYNELHAEEVKPQRIGNETAWTGFGFTLECGNYTCNDDGISYIDKFGDDVSVCSHPITPSAILENIHTGEYFIELSYKLQGEDYWKKQIFPKRTLSSKSDIIELSRINVNVTTDNDRELVKFLSYMMESKNNRKVLPSLKLANNLGWIGNEFAPYSTAFEYNPQGGHQKLQDAIQPTGSMAEWLRVSAFLRKSDFIGGRAALAASFASVLLSLAKGLPFVVHLHGQSGTGKSISLRIIASVWGNGSIEGGGYIVPASSTTNALEAVAGYLHDLPILMDELETRHRREGETFDQLIYALAEGSGKSRATKNGGLAMNTASWNNATIITAEHPIITAKSRTGAANRVLQFSINKPIFSATEAQDIAVTTQENYGHAGKLFIEELQKIENVNQFVSDLVKEKLKEIRASKNGQSGKQEQTAAFILAADKLATEWIFKDNRCLTASDIAPYLQTMDEIDQNNGAYYFLTEYVSSHPDKFGIGGQFATGSIMGNAVLDELHDVSEYQFIKSEFDKLMTENGYSPENFIAWAKQKDILDHDAGRNTKVIRIKYSMGSSPATRCIAFRALKDMDKPITTQAETETKTDYTESDYGDVLGLAPDDIPFDP